MAKANIVVLGLDTESRKLLEAAHNNEYNFYNLYDLKEILFGPQFDIAKLLKKAKEELPKINKEIHAIVGFWDFPAVLLMPILRSQVGLKGPHLESVLKCEHKYLSRVEQSKIINEHIPKFLLVDPCEEKSNKQQLPLPLWIKPVKAHSSILGYKVSNANEYDLCRKKICMGIGQFAKPLNDLMAIADLNALEQAAHGGMCIAEEIISAKNQCTLEGYVKDNQIYIYGVIDSIRKENYSSLESYEYPSSLPQNVQEKMIDIAKRAIKKIGLNQSPFNIEFFYDPHTRRISLLEINARISRSHAPLFYMVDGVPNTRVMIEVALGNDFTFKNNGGPFTYAAKFMPRIYDKKNDKVVIKTPSSEKLAQIQKQFDGCTITLHVKEGMRLSQLLQQDSYSYQLATIFMGAHSKEALYEKYEHCMKLLDIRLGNIA